jgi:hypothetical protein
MWRLFAGVTGRSSPPGTGLRPWPSGDPLAGLDCPRLSPLRDFSAAQLAAVARDHEAFGFCRGGALTDAFPSGSTDAKRARPPTFHLRRSPSFPRGGIAPAGCRRRHAGRRPRKRTLDRRPMLTSGHERDGHGLSRPSLLHKISPPSPRLILDDLRASAPTRIATNPSIGPAHSTPSRQLTARSSDPPCGASNDICTRRSR